MTAVHPVYVDGPLMGQDYPLHEHQIAGGLRYLPPIHPRDWDSLGEATHLPMEIYHFREVPMFGRWILVGAVRWPVADTFLFTALVSGAGKNAVTRVDPVSAT